MRLLFGLALFAALGCGPKVPSDNYGSLALKFSQQSDAVDKAELTISGAGIEPPLVASFTMEAEEGSLAMQGIPAGEDRRVRVQCFDKAGVAIGDYTVEHVSIRAGATTELALPITTGTTQVTGGLAISVTIGEPPTLRYISASPLRPKIGESVSLTAVADGSSDAIYGYAWSAAPEGEFSAPNESQTSFIPKASGQCVVTLRVNAGDFSRDYTLSLSVEGGGEASTDPSVPSSIVINEILADPPEDSSGDANQDGIRSTADDEFIEIVNGSSRAVDLSGYTLSDATAIRHTFAQGTSILAGKALVVFGGGNPTLASSWQVAASGGLSLNNTSEQVVLKNATGTVIDSHTYGAEGGKDQSLVRVPDVTGTFALHTSTATKLYSPGSRANGSPF